MHAIRLIIITARGCCFSLCRDSFAYALVRFSTIIIISHMPLHDVVVRAISALFILVFHDANNPSPHDAKSRPKLFLPFALLLMRHLFT